MPIYEYRCKNGHVIEKAESLGTNKPFYCPRCCEMATKIISIPAKCVIKMGIHIDSGLPQEYISNARTPEIYERNVARQGKIIEPEDM